MTPGFIFLAVLAYIGFLFLIAYFADQETPAAKRLTRSPLIYALSLTVYCTSWTFYGSVGKAATSGLSFLGVYIGPTIMVSLWWLLLRRMVQIKERFRITSIADFISARYGKSELIAGAVTLIALVGNMPYLALQIKAIRSSFDLLAAAESASGSWISDHFGLCIVSVMTLFTILFGARKLDPTERHRGMITAIAFESVIKLATFLACGIYVTYGLAGGFSGIFSPTFTGTPAAATVLGFGQGPQAYINWTTMVIVSMAACTFLPRQFHVAVVENNSPKAILTAAWAFPLYLLAINLFVVPIALYGLHAGIPVAQADTYVLSIPLQQGNNWISLLVFIGGFSASTSMIMIVAMTMSTMIVNHLLLPLFNLVPPLGVMRRFLLRWHWAGIVFVIILGYWTETKIGEASALASMGLISHTMAIQFAPMAIGAVVWPQGNKTGALSGLMAGFAVWFYTLLLPAFVKAGWWFDRSLLDQGPWGLGLLRPEHLFGLNALSPLPHAVFWIVLFNLGGYVAVSCFTSQSEEEHRLAQEFHTAAEKSILPDQHIEIEQALESAPKYSALLGVLNDYFPEDKSRAILDQGLTEFGLQARSTLSIIEFAEWHRSVESMLAGSIGSAMAHKALGREQVFSRQEKQALSKAYAELLSRLNVSPQELAEKINFYREREQLLTLHSRELEQRIKEKEHEIEARKQAEQAMKQAELRYRSIFDNALEGIFQTSPNGAYLTVNPAMAVILGYDSPQMLLTDAPNLGDHLAVEPSRFQTLVERLHQGGEVKNFEIRATRRQGEPLWLNLNARPITDGRGRLSRIEGIAEDITKRKEAEDKLARYHVELEEKVRLRTAEVRENQIFLQEVLEGIQAAVIVLDQDSREMLDCNSIMEELLGYPKEELLGADSPLSADHPLFAELRDKSLNKEFIAQKREGAKLPVLRNVLPVVYKGRLAYAVILFDISERKALEQQVNMAQKLQAIGQLAAGIAHEINTPIQYIGNNIRFLSESFEQLLDIHSRFSHLMDQAKSGVDLEGPIEEVTARFEELDLEYLREEIPHAVKESLSGVDQVASIVQAMKQFAHPEQEKQALVDINQALRQTAAVSRNEWKYVADLHFELDPANPVISGYPGPLNQVFLNLLINAAHAIGEQGGQQGGDKGLITLRTAAGPAAVVVSISDTGCGIAAENLHKIFDPFYTTKAVGQGTGQGLSIAYTIIRDKHRGTIEAASEPGRGTTFTITLPLQPQ